MLKSTASRRCFALCLCLAATKAWAAPLSRNPLIPELDLNKSANSVVQAQVIDDQSRTLSIEQIRELEKKGKENWETRNNLNFGYSDDRFWMKIPISNRNYANTDWSLEFGYPMIQDIRFYQFTDGKLIKGQTMGRLKPFGSRPVDHWNFIFEFSLPPGGHTDLYVMIQSQGHVVAPMRIYTHDALLSKSIRRAMGWGIYCGIVLAMVLYNLFLFISIRDRNYLLYLIYAVSLGLLQCNLNGTTYQFLWPNWVRWNNISCPLVIGAGYVFLTLFTKSVLETKRLVPKLDKGLNVIIFAGLFLALWGLFHYQMYTNRFASFLMVITPIYILPVSLICLWKGSRVAIYYSIAFGCFLTGAAILSAEFIGWTPRSFITVNAMYFGSAAETILLSLALAARIKILKEEKLKSELQATKATRELSESQQKLEKQLAVSALASQVAHDIKSPLAALDVVARDLSQLGEGSRILVRSAVGRIRDIANNLIETNREIKASIDEATGTPVLPAAKASASIELLSSHIDLLITEKRLQYRSRIGVEIDSRMNELSYGLFAKVQPVEFKRVLSNLINNSVEALGEKGSVTVFLTSEDGFIYLAVRDDGKGIPSQILAKLGRRGESHGKKGGLGLGLNHAKTCAESWGGTLKIESEIEKGATVTLILPQTPAPEWFISELVLAEGESIVILDDDTSIHRIWQERLNNLNAQSHGIKTFHFSTPRELKEWVSKKSQGMEALYLLDYELLGYNESGLALAEELGIGDRTILVTSRYEDPGIMEACQKLNVRMIPKGLAGLVPIRVQAEGVPSESFDAVLIDNDPLVRTNWKMAASKAGKRFRSYISVQEFLTQSHSIDRRTPVYIDVELGHGVKGDQESIKLANLGFQHIYLATGHETSKFATLTHLKGVVGKSPPWELEPALSGKTT